MAAPLLTKFLFVFFEVWNIISEHNSKKDFPLFKFFILNSEYFILILFEALSQICQKATISFVMSARLSVRTEQLGSYCKDIQEIKHLIIF
jgi:hypothetical protein